MMWHSDNARTLEVITWEGANGAVDSFMQNTVGMTDTSTTRSSGARAAGRLHAPRRGPIYEKDRDGTLLGSSTR